MDRVYVSMGSNSNKNSQFKIIKPQAHLCIIGRKPTKFQMNSMKDVEGVEETRFLIYKAYVSMGNTSIKNSSIENPKPHAHVHIWKKVYIISNESDERCRRGCGDKIMVGKVLSQHGQ